MEEVDLHLAGADLVDQGVDAQAHLLAVAVDVLEQRIELVHGIDRVGLAGGLGAAAAADRRLERHVRIGVACDQVELQLGRDDRRPALGGVQLAHAAQDRARRERGELAVAVVAVVDHLRRRVGGPGHDAHRARVGAQMHVGVVRADDVVVGALLRELAGHAHRHHALRQAHAAVLGELRARQDLAARHAGEVGHEAFDLGHAALVEPAFEFGEARILGGRLVHAAIVDRSTGEGARSPADGRAPGARALRAVGPRHLRLAAHISRCSPALSPPRIT